MLLAIDFETFWSTKCSIKTLGTTRYIRHPDFHVHGAAASIDDGPARWYSVYDLPPLLADIDWSETDVLAHNAGFDGSILTTVYGIDPPRRWLDSQGIARWNAPGRSASLAAASERLFPETADMRKGDALVLTRGRTFKDLFADPAVWRALGLYAIQDLTLCRSIYAMLGPSMPEVEMFTIDHTVRMMTEPKFALDRPRAQNIVRQELQASKEMFEAAGVSKEVLRSNDQFAEHLVSLGITVPMKANAKGKQIPAFAKSDQGWLNLRAERPDLTALFDAREASKSRLNETRAQRFLDHVDPFTGAFAVPLNYGAAHTMRFGGTDLLNLQNLPKDGDLRGCLIPLHDDEVLYVADYSSIEARKLAWLVLERAMLDPFSAGEDLYCRFASMVFGRTITPADSAERQVGKIAVLGLGYGMGVVAFVSFLKADATLRKLGVELELTVVRRIVSLYRTTFARISGFWKTMSNTLFALSWGQVPPSPDPHGLIQPALEGSLAVLHLFGEARLEYPNLRRVDGDLVFDRRGKEGKTFPVYIHGAKCVENIIQYLSRCTMVYGQKILHEQMPELRVALTAHDEFVAVGPREGAEDRLKAACAILRKAIPPWSAGLPLNVEGWVGERYGK